MLTAQQLRPMFPDLHDARFESALALVHQRFSTNTFPSWPLAHPYRMVAHNGEINTLRGNINWMRAREGLLQSQVLGDDLKKVIPVIREGGSDTATFDNVLELLVMAGRSLPHAILMMIPEPWSGNDAMSPDRRAFYEYHSSLMEPWDGPASIAFTDGSVIGAVLDRNGLRPSRYYVTKDDLVVMASEVGVLEFAPENILEKGRLSPGRIFLVDTTKGRIVGDDEIKRELAAQHPYQPWLDTHLVDIESLPTARAEKPERETVFARQQVFGYTQEDLRLLIGPMAQTGEEPLGSMGTDSALAVLSDRPRVLYDYFKQLFAQVTNPPLDAIREELVTSMGSTIGPERNLLEPVPEACRQIHIKYPIIHNEHLAKLRHLSPKVPFRSITLSTLFDPALDGPGLTQAMDELCRKASEAVKKGFDILILSDRGISADMAPIPSLLATAGVHHHLVREGTRTKCALVVESGDAREVHHVSLLLGYGAGVVNPYVAFETIDDMIRQGLLPGIERDKAIQHYIKALNKGVLKVMSKMGISTLQSYCGAQIFEAVGLQPVAHRPLLHAHHVPHRRHRHRDAVRGSAAAARARVRAPARPSAGARAGRRVPVAARRRVPPVQPGDRVQAAARDAHRPVPDLQAVHDRGERPEPAPRHAARSLPVQAGRSGRAHRRGGVGGHHRQALRDRRDVLRLDQPERRTRRWRLP